MDLVAVFIYANNSRTSRPMIAIPKLCLQVRRWMIAGRYT